MKIILLKDVANIGRAGTIKDVSDGYARNFLLPQKLADIATAHTIKKLEEEAKNKKVKKEKEHEGFHALRSALVERGISIKKKTDEKGGLYAAISAKDILEALRELNFPVPKNIAEDAITFDAPIKTTGSGEARIHFPPNEKIVVKVEVEKL